LTAFIHVLFETYFATIGHPRYAKSTFTLEVISWIPEDPFPTNDFPVLPYHETYEAHDKRYREARDAGGSGDITGSDDGSDGKSFIHQVAETIENSKFLEVLFKIILEVLT
jgi:hypothetical protein